MGSPEIDPDEPCRAYNWLIEERVPAGESKVEIDGPSTVNRRSTQVGSREKAADS